MDAAVIDLGMNAEAWVGASICVFHEDGFVSPLGWRRSLPG
jgi:hypothetical protein